MINFRKLFVKMLSDCSNRINQISRVNKKQEIKSPFIKYVNILGICNHLLYNLQIIFARCFLDLFRSNH